MLYHNRDLVQIVDIYNCTCVHMYICECMYVYVYTYVLKVTWYTM